MKKKKKRGAGGRLLVVTSAHGHVLSLSNFLAIRGALLLCPDS